MLSVSDPKILELGFQNSHAALSRRLQKSISFQGVNFRKYSVLDFSEKSIEASAIDKLTNWIISKFSTKSKYHIGSATIASVGDINILITENLGTKEAPIFRGHEMVDFPNTFRTYTTIAYLYCNIKTGEYSLKTIHKDREENLIKALKFDFHTTLPEWLANDKEADYWLSRFFFKQISSR